MAHTNADKERNEYYRVIPIIESGSKDLIIEGIANRAVHQFQSQELNEERRKMQEWIKHPSRGGETPVGEEYGNIVLKFRSEREAANNLIHALQHISRWTEDRGIQYHAKKAIDEYVKHTQPQTPIPEKGYY